MKRLLANPLTLPADLQEQKPFLSDLLSIAVWSLELVLKAFIKTYYVGFLYKKLCFYEHGILIEGTTSFDLCVIHSDVQTQVLLKNWVVATALDYGSWEKLTFFVYCTNCSETLICRFCCAFRQKRMINFLFFKIAFVSLYHLFVFYTIHI